MHAMWAVARYTKATEYLGILGTDKTFVFLLTTIAIALSHLFALNKSKPWYPFTR